MLRRGEILTETHNTIDSGQDSNVTAIYHEGRPATVAKEYFYNLDKNPEMRVVINRYLLDTAIYSEIVNGDSSFNAKFRSGLTNIRIQFQVTRQGNNVTETRKTIFKQDWLEPERDALVITQEGQEYCKGRNLLQYFSHHYEYMPGFDHHNQRRNTEEDYVPLLEQLGSGNSWEDIRNELVKILEDFCKKLNEKAKVKLKESYEQAGLPPECIPEVHAIDLRNIVPMHDPKDSDLIHFMITDTALKLQRDYKKLIEHLTQTSNSPQSD